MMIFIVTAAIQPHTLHVLRECLGSVRLHHPDASIVTIDALWAEEEHEALRAAYGAQFVRQLHPGCGEVNAFCWSVQHAEADARVEDRYVFLQDSVHLTAPLPPPKAPHFDALWYSSGAITCDLDHPEIARALCVDGVPLTEDVAAAGVTGECIFGAMATWSSTFARALGSRTTLTAAAALFTTKSKRCMLERALFFVARRLGFVPSERAAFRHSVLLGDIWRHPHAFSNRQPQAARGVFPATKMWFGR